MKTRTIIVAIFISIIYLVSARSQTSSFRPIQDRLIIRSEQFSALQRLLDERTSQCRRVANISYHTSIKNLHSKGLLEIRLEKTDASEKYEYRALTTEMEAPALARVLRENGAKGFRLLKQTPIPLELGLLRPREMFVVVMEKVSGSPAIFTYYVVAYRHRLWVQDSIKKALADGYVEVCTQQLGSIIYAVMEKQLT